jgi:glycosyltransferase involved in cell wall biosynthesis
MSRVLVLTSRYPPHHEGGYEVSCHDVVERWRRRGHDVTVLTSTWRRPGTADPAGARAAGVRRDLHLAYRDGALSRPPLLRRRGVEVADHRALQDAIDAAAPDVVSVWHMGSLSTGLLTKLAGTGLPLVFVVCDDWPTYAHRNDPWMRLFFRWPALGRRVERIAGVPATLPDLGQAGTFCFISASTRDRCAARSPWSFPSSTVTFSGVDLEVFPLVASERARPWDWRLVNTGRLSPRKGLETAVRALALLPPEATLELLPAADGPFRSHLEAVAAEVGVADRLHVSVVPRAELRGHYERAGACVFPSEWDEPFGLVALEAMACGTPVVATAAGGSGEFLVDGENCVRCEPGDPRSVAAAVRRLAGDPDLRDRIVHRGTRTAAELSVDRLADVLEAWHVAASDRFRHGRPADRTLSLR